MRSGFKYRYVPETGEYAHTAVTMICTPDGRLSRYLYGVEYDQQTLRLSLLEASRGQDRHADGSVVAVLFSVRLPRRASMLPRRSS